jgi:hypothetical protein
MLEARWLQFERWIPGRERTASRFAQTPGSWDHALLIYSSINQQDATLHDGIYYYKCSTRFKRSSTHHQELKIVYTASGICRVFLLLTAIVGEFPMIAVRSRKSSTSTQCCIYSFDLLMMGGGTA